MTITYSTANDIANLSLEHHLRGLAKGQTTEDKPLLRILKQNQKTFGGGGGSDHYIARNVRGKYMVDTAGFLQGITGTDTLVFKQSENVIKARYRWYEQAVNLVVTETELKEGGVTVVDDMRATPMSRNDIAVVTNILQERVGDFMESYARAQNLMFWQDGSTDAKHTPGILSIITDTGLGDTVGGIDSSNADYDWWHNRCRVGTRAYTTGTGMNEVTSPTGPKIVPSKSEQTLTRFLRGEKRQLRRYGGKPSVILAGSGFIEALEYELEVKGQYTETGFSAKQTDIGIADISLKGLGTFVYDPTLDNLGLSKRCYIWDPAAIIRMPMEGNADKMRSPTRPADRLVFLKTITDTSALVCWQRNCNGVYEVA